jgi:pyroglutamyl-peptidase
VFYVLQHVWAQPGRCCGFVHLPCLPAQVAGRSAPAYPSMALPLQVQAVREMSRLLLD